jgi:hypothetical protein
MKKPPARKPKTKKAAKPSTAKAGQTEIELKPGVWEKFEALMRRAAKMGRVRHAPAKKKRK